MQEYKRRIAPVPKEAFSTASFYRPLDIVKLTINKKGTVHDGKKPSCSSSLNRVWWAITGSKLLTSCL